MRYKITIEYDGSEFCGWQKQNYGISIQSVIESAIQSFTNSDNIQVIGAGRTDAGVHAKGQVAHFDLQKIYNPDKIISAINHFVRPHKISILNCITVDNDFHARFSAIKRSYTYRIINRKAPVMIEKKLCWWFRKPLLIDPMRQAAQYLVGQHNFTSFRSSICQARSPIRTIDSIQLLQDTDIITITITARSFLHHMVRNIVGTLTAVGETKWHPHDIQQILLAKSRAAAGQTAPPQGLYFMSVEY